MKVIKVALIRKVLKMKTINKLYLGTVVSVLAMPAFAADAGAGALAAINGALDEAKPYGYAVIAVLAGLMVFKFIKKVL